MVFDGVPQQLDNDCGIFKIEFMRALIGGQREVAGLAEMVSPGTMKMSRQHIVREIPEREIIKEKQLGVVGGTRSRKKTRRAE